jgi:hypothetical protein
VYRTVILSYNVATGQDSPFPPNAEMKLNNFKCEKKSLKSISLTGSQEKPLGEKAQQALQGLKRGQVRIYALFHLHDQ